MKRYIICPSCNTKVPLPEGERAAQRAFNAHQKTAAHIGRLKR